MSGDYKSNGSVENVHICTYRGESVPVYNVIPIFGSPQWSFFHSNETAYLCPRSSDWLAFLDPDYVIYRSSAIILDPLSQNTFLTTLHTFWSSLIFSPKRGRYQMIMVNRMVYGDLSATNLFDNTLHVF